MGTDIWDGEPGEVLPVTRGELRRMLANGYASGCRGSMGGVMEAEVDPATCRDVSGGDFECSECGMRWPIGGARYCPECGRMVEERAAGIHAS